MTSAHVNMCVCVRACCLQAAHFGKAAALSEILKHPDGPSAALQETARGETALMLAEVRDFSTSFRCHTQPFRAFDESFHFGTINFPRF